MITGRQCRAARALIGWTQGDLGDRCGLSKTAINNFETGNASIKQSSAEAIKRALELKYIGFLPNEGVMLNNVEQALILHGRHHLHKIWEEILINAEEDKSDVLIITLREMTKKDSKAMGLSDFLKDLQKLGVKERIIVGKSNADFHAPKDWYRTIDDEFLTYGTANIIFGNKVAFILWHSDTLILANSRIVKETEEKKFETLWESATKP